MGDLVRTFLQESARLAWVETKGYPEAKQLEDRARRGELGEVPLINPWPGEPDPDS
jgi:hypothetical protein